LCIRTLCVKAYSITVNGLKVKKSASIPTEDEFNNHVKAGIAGYVHSGRNQSLRLKIILNTVLTGYNKAESQLLDHNKNPIGLQSDKERKMTVSKERWNEAVKKTYKLEVKQN